MSIKVSICIPTYNRRDYLAETLKSISSQTYKDYEIVIVDDGSTDGTKQMVRELDFPVRYYWQENAGDAAARNKLIELADSKYITFIDSDDLLFHDSIERMVKAIPEGADDVIVYGPYVAIDQHGNICRRRRKRLYSGNITCRLFNDILVHSCGSMFPIKVLKEFEGFDVTLPVCSDYYLWLRLSLKSRFVAISKPMFKRRRHASNLSAYTMANRITELNVLERFYYENGGDKIVPKRMAMRRFGKEEYRVGRCALRERKYQQACEYFKKSLRKIPDSALILIRAKLPSI